MLPDRIENIILSRIDKLIQLFSTTHLADKGVEMNKGLIEHFEKLTDSRIDRTKRYPLIEIILLIIAGNESRIRTEASPENFAIMRHIALNLIKNDTSRKASMKRKRFMAALEDDFREMIIKQVI